VSEVECVGPCNNRLRKAREEYTKALLAYDDAVEQRATDPSLPEPQKPEPPEIRPWYGNPFCPRCQAKLRLRLAELDDLAAIVAREADGHRGGPDAERVSGSRATQSPSPAVDALDEMASALRGWEAAARGPYDTPPRRGYLATEITTTVCWLVAHFDTLITNEDMAEDFAREIGEWHRMLIRMTKAGSARHAKPMPCPRCGARSLEWEEGAEHIECCNRDWGHKECRKLMSLTEYDAAFDAWEKNGHRHIAA
jgi:hypothetical protein